MKDVDVKGIQAYRFAPPADVLMNPTDNPANQGFCVPAGDCLGTGVLKVSVCREGRYRLLEPLTDAYKTSGAKTTTGKTDS